MKVSRKALRPATIPIRMCVSPQPAARSPLGGRREPADQLEQLLLPLVSDANASIRGFSCESPRRPRGSRGPARRLLCPHRRPCRPHSRNSRSIRTHHGSQRASQRLSPAAEGHEHGPSSALTARQVQRSCPHSGTRRQRPGRHREPLVPLPELPRAIRCRRAGPNRRPFWRTATYQALANSSWYINGGYMLG